ncbi:hypothetical protein [Shewanella xiamenensis]|uniref:hypothetical protein n=1 Tax=Shewanella xiamenensis TaxID=332186 RepID=UPI0024A64AC2|nr:hypothetical protein [Shewanella xiamenensis]MDI5835238.1 hypothetical protein [Shewanella xiamenensis]MDI5839037.1 hypothetical protein [Shewanella xiamenensis]MDI5843068.1 hypothetical protein [Shewanella xiamenensis]MDI5847001.1 hypothetical protein [Shewanella xiamenensis]MDI5851277.1 hypothetical protein [Shewanella xiamenensis]
MFGISKYSAVKCLNYVGAIRAELFSKELELLINEYVFAYDNCTIKLECIRDKIKIAHNFNVKDLMDELMDDWDKYDSQILTQEIENMAYCLNRCNEFVDTVLNNWTDRIGGNYNQFKTAQLEKSLESTSLFSVPKRHITAKFLESRAYKKYQSNLPNLDKIQSLYDQVSRSMEPF